MNKLQKKCSLNKSKFLEFHFVKIEQNIYIYISPEFFYLSVLIHIILFERLFELQQMTLPAKSSLKWQL